MKTLSLAELIAVVSISTLAVSTIVMLYIFVMILFHGKIVLYEPTMAILYFEIGIATLALAYIIIIGLMCIKKR